MLLVGGPGNGKTEAIEATLEQLDNALGCAGKLTAALGQAFRPADGKAPRCVRVDARPLGANRTLTINVVQDATVELSGQTPAQLLLSELTSIMAEPAAVYLCCVNRGVLDDALIFAHDQGFEAERNILESIVQAVSLAPDASSCWPLHGYPDLAVWPMDAESLVDSVGSSDPSPAETIARWAIAEDRWPASESCAAGKSCPFCSSRKTLAGRKEFDALLRMLRWFELAAGKRWAFRDVFSLMSFLLAGPGSGSKGAAVDPCEWAAAQLELDRRAEAGAKPVRDTSGALFFLVAAQYQQALFHKWEHAAARALLQDIKDLGLEGDNTAMGLYYFLHSRHGRHVPPTIGPLVDAFAETLDPAMASPDECATLWGAGGPVPLREFDARFSRSVREGLDYSIPYRALSQLERMLLARLSVLDELLSTPRLRSKRPTAATRIQRLARDFSSRLVRRSIGARQAIVPDLATLEAYEKVVADSDGDGHDIREIANQVEDLLNDGDHFLVSLTTTFGQPMPPPRGRAVLVVRRRRVSVREGSVEGRPRSSLCFLEIEVGDGFQPIALTYDLFRAVKDLGRGVSQASLPRAVLTLLDTTRARMAGSIVRDRDALERTNIHLGGSTAISRQRGRFVSDRTGGTP
ncbi:MAG: hypothetical protein ACK4TP_14720 [Hyphomicrobium sp.]